MSKPLQHSHLSANDVMLIFTFSSWVAICRGRAEFCLFIDIIVLHTLN